MRFRIQTLPPNLAGGLLIVLLASGGAVGQTQQVPANASKSDAITGKVVNDSGQPLPNATVWVRAVGSRGPGESVATDRDGTFRLTGLQRVPYSIRAMMPAYHPPLREPDNSRPTEYKVGDSVTLVLIKGGVITGKVTTSDGDPVVAIGVRVEMIRDGNGRRVTSGRLTSEVPTDDRGIYRVYGLPTGTYIVGAVGRNDHSHTGFNAYESDVPTYASSSTRETASEISVRAGEETTDVDIRYRGEPGHSINGIVSGPARDHSGFTVTLTSIGEGGSQVNDTSSMYQEPGSREFVFNGLADGDYYLTAQSHLEKGEMAVSDSKLIKIRGEDVTGIELVTQPLASISGRVVLEETKAVECTDKERPVLTETSVSAWHKEQEAAKDRARFIWSMGVPMNADAQGNVTLRHLAAGEYRFATRFTGKYWYLQSISFTRPSAKTPAKPIDAMKTWTTVKSGDRLSGLTVTLAQGAASLAGQLVLGEGETVPEKLFAYLVPAEREKADDVLRFYAAAVNADGKIALNNLAPGRYWILAQPPIDGAESPLTKLRLPDETETRLRLRRAAEAAKTEIELKPCQDVVDFRLPK